MSSNISQSRRWFLRVAGTAGVASMTGLAGCMGGSGDDSGNNSTGSKGGQMANKVRLYNMGSLQYDPGTAKNLKRFEEETGITVEVSEVPWSNLKTTLITEFRTESAKVDAFMAPTWWLADFVTAGWISPLGLSDDHMKKFPKNLRKLVTFDGNVYLAPSYGKWGSFVYNKPYLSKHGLDTPPGTWEEVISMGKKLKSGSAIPFAVAWDTRAIFTFKSLLYQAGGQLFDENNQPTFVDKGTQVFDEYLLPLQKQGLFPRGMTSWNTSAIRDNFVPGNLAMTESWTPLATWVLDTKWNKSRLGSAKIPKGPVSRATFQDSAGVVVSAFSERKGAAKKLAEFMSSTESIKRDMLVEGNPAVVPAVYDDPEIRDEFPSDLLEDLKYNLRHAKSEIYRAQPEVDEAISNQITPALLGDKPPAKALKQAESDITQLYQNLGIL